MSDLKAFFILFIVKELQTQFTGLILKLIEATAVKGFKDFKSILQGFQELSDIILRVFSVNQIKEAVLQINLRVNHSEDFSLSFTVHQN